MMSHGAAKFHDRAQGLVSQEVEGRAQELIYGLEGLADVKDLMALLKG